MTVITLPPGTSFGSKPCYPVPIASWHKTKVLLPGFVYSDRFEKTIT